MRPVTVVIAIALAAAGVLLILFAWRPPPFATAVVITQESYVRGKVTALSSQVTGYVAQVLVADYAHVRAGQVLVRIDDRSYRATLAQDRAKVDSAQADLDNAAQTIASNQADVAAKEADVVSSAAERQLRRADRGRASATCDAARESRPCSRSLPNGYSTYLDQLDTQRNYYASQIAAVTIRRDQLINIAALYVALGGGWSLETSASASLATPMPAGLRPTEPQK